MKKNFKPIDLNIYDRLYMFVYNRSGGESYDNRIPVFSITSCYGAVQSHILRCEYSAGPPSATCDHSNNVFLECGK